MKGFKRKWWPGLLLAGAVLMPVAQAQDVGQADDTAGGGFFSNMWSRFDVSGYLRAESAYKTTSDENPYNQRGNPFNGKTVDRCGGVPPSDVCLFPDTATRTGEPADNDFNLLFLRGRVDFGYKFTGNFKFIGSIRGIYDPTVYEEFDPAAVDSQAVGQNYGKPNYFEFDTPGLSNPNPLEIAGRDYMVDLPAFFFDYQNGPMLLRIGNQQIAWGQALFFRVLDVPNGLDLRRHSVLDFVPEEFSDKRVPALGIRASYQISEDWEVDSFGQKFQPTIYGNANTPYNVIASQFSINDRYSSYDDEINYGGRVRGRLGNFGVQAIAVSRMNPDGVFRWTASNVNRGLPGVLPNVLPGLTDTVGELLGQVVGPDGLPLTGAILAETPFEVDPTGVVSAEEWFTFAGMARLNGITALNAAIDEYPAARLLLAQPVDSYEAARRELDTFFQLSGGLRGHLAREYFREEIYGLGGSYVIEGEPGSLLDQLIINVEANYTPKRRFTNPSLSADYIEHDEYQVALVSEKYHRFSQSFPATYLVLQYLHKSESDIFGRHLSGYGGSPEQVPEGIDGGSNYVAFAFQQPFPNLVWRVDFAALYDLEGGLLVQPAIRWKPTGAWTVEAFYNYIDTVKGNPNKNALSTAEWADEITLRVGYQF